MASERDAKNRRRGSIVLVLLLTAFLSGPARANEQRGRNWGSGSVLNVTAPSADTDKKDENKDENPFADMPLGAFLTTLAIAALIGATGGRVYVGIVGQRD